ncbi:MAG: penicillin acylase family protein [Acidimicrobiia bacterium]|nr:penicillin acylase family protein [Acidimicrobiia bacterium]
MARLKPSFAGALTGVVSLVVVLSIVPQAEQTPDARLRELARASLATLDGEQALQGLRAPVEVIRDRWGIPHIYAQNTDDLFFAQGYVMAQDRLWQMELWRRDKEGRMAEILGPQAIDRDRQARLLRYRGPMDDREWTSYHPEGKRIFEAYAAGVNAFIAAHQTNLPLEFTLTGITPDPWTAETVVLRTATFGDANTELNLAREVVRLGREAANKQRAPDPWDDLALPQGLNLSIIDENVSTNGGGVGGVGGAGRGGRGGNTPEILPQYRDWVGAGRGRGGVDLSVLGPSTPLDPPGSNNWVVSGRLSATGKPVVVNDPHRTVTHPSLRYVVHLNAPGWNVIGSGEVPFVGVAIGHNDRLGWGLTIVGTDMEDVYVEDVNPANPNEVRFRGQWEPVRIVREDVPVKGAATETIELKFTRHGPVFYEDRARHKAYVLRSALLEPGTAPYLGGLRLAQSTDCKHFLTQAMYWKAPSENLICGDVDGNISWMAAALTPDRRAVGPDGRSWVGRLPVPGTGAYEWNGFRRDLPQEFNPERGFIVTANHNVQPKDYAPPLMFKSSANLPYDRITRLLQLFDTPQAFTLEDHRRMQLDAKHLRAEAELALFRGWTSAIPDVERARQVLAAWDAVLTVDSAAGALYDVWRGLSTAAERDGARAVGARSNEHEATLAKALPQLVSSQGADWSQWRWGRIHTRSFAFPLVPAYSLPTVERPGGTGTVAAPGASFREILDVADWDRSLITNVPGQSAQPESPFFSNLHALWARDEFFPLVYSRLRVEKERAHTLTLRPR